MEAAKVLWYTTNEHSPKFGTKWKLHGSLCQGGFLKKKLWYQKNCKKLAKIIKFTLEIPKKICWKKWLFGKNTGPISKQEV
jgi:hypothetical protein